MRYKKEKVLKALGEKVQSERKEQDLEIEDIVEMTGFNYNTIRKLEAGSESTLSYFIEICLALKMHPKYMLDIPIEITSRYPLSPTRKEKTRLTLRISRYIENNFFAKQRSASEVVKELVQDYGIKTSTSAASVILHRFEKEGQLESFRIGGKNYYCQKNS